jgi:putative ABC transport system permease protein
VSRYVVLGRLVALRSLTARPLRSLLSCVGIGAGVALVLAIQLVNGAVVASVRGSVDAVAGRAVAEVVAPTDGGVSEATLPPLRAVPGVAAVVGVVRADGTITVGADERVITLLGVPGDYDQLAPAGRPARLEGGFGPPGSASVVLPDGLAARLGVGIGDAVRLAVRSERREVRVSGILRGGDLTRSDAGNVALMALPEAQALLRTPRMLDAAFVVAADAADADRVRAAAAETVGPGLTVREPAARAGQSARVLRGISQLLTLASTVALFVGMFVVYNTMSMATTERRRELALLRALGLRRREEERLLYLEAALLGVGGGLAGLAGGYALARLLVGRVTEGYALLLTLPPVRVEPRPGLLVAAFLAGVVAAVVAAVLPARRMRRVPPVEGMRAGTPTEDVSEETRWGWRAAGRVGLPALGAGLACMAVFLTVAGDQVGWAVAGLTGLMVTLAAVVPVVVPRVVAVVARPLLARSPLVARLAETSLQRTPRRTSYTVGALLVTLMLVIGLGGALTSFRVSLDRLIAVVARADVYVVAGESLTTTIPSDVATDLRARPEIGAVWRYRFTPVLWDGSQVALQAWDMTPFRTRASLVLESGDAERALDETIAGRATIVSTTLARDRGLSVGDTVAIPTPRGPVELAVAGIATDFLPQGTFYLDWDEAVARYGDAGTGSVAVVASGSVAAARRAVREVLATRGLEADLQSRAERADAVLSGIDRTFALADGVQLAGLLVALVAVVNTLLMTVVERKRELGTLRALGLLRRQVRRLVMTEALVIGVVGGLLAAVAGFALSLFVTTAMEVGNGWSQVTVVPWRAMLLAPVAAGLVAAVGGWWPARRAARIPVVEAIRSE